MSKTHDTLLGTGLALLLLLLAACATAPPTPTPTPDPDAATPADIVTARTAAVDYLRDGARCFVPTRLSAFHPLSDGDYQTPPGYDVYRFNSENCLVTVTKEQEPAGDPLYHVAIGDQDTGYCLQAIVGVSGTVLHTGTAAADAQNPGNFAAQYCQEQGHTYEIRALEDGTMCGACIFADGSACRSWDYFHGVCQPGDNMEAN